MVERNKLAILVLYIVWHSVVTYFRKNTTIEIWVP